MTALGDIQAQVDQTCGAVDRFRRSVEAGMVIDLAGLDRSVEAMCGAIARLPADDRPPLKNVLVALLDELNALVAALEAQQGDVFEKLKGVSSRQRAVAAYAKGASPDKPGKDTPKK